MFADGMRRRRRTGSAHRNPGSDGGDIWNEYSARAFEYAGTQAGVKVETVVLDSKNSLEESVTAMESLIQQGVDGISIFPISTEQGAQLVKMANEAGIPVTVENFKMDVEDPGDYIASVACEYDQIGYEAIKYISEVHPNAKVFFCAGQQGAGVYEKYQEGVDRAIEEFGDQVEIVATLHGDWLTDKAYNVTTDLIASGEEFDIFRQCFIASCLFIFQMGFSHGRNDIITAEKPGQLYIFHKILPSFPVHQIAMPAQRKGNEGKLLHFLFQASQVRKRLCRKNMLSPPLRCRKFHISKARFMYPLQCLLDRIAMITV